MVFLDKLMLLLCLAMGLFCFMLGMWNKINWLMISGILFVSSSNLMVSLIIVNKLHDKKQSLITNGGGDEQTHKES